MWNEYYKHLSMHFPKNYGASFIFPALILSYRIIFPATFRYRSEQCINASRCSSAGLILECFRQAWDLAVDTCLSQLHDVVSGKKTFQVRLYS